MKFRLIYGLAIFCAVMLPVQAAQARPLMPRAICADKTTGEVSGYEDSLCPRTTWDLGLAALHHGDVRPAELDPRIVPRLNALETAAKRAGFTITVRSGFRTMAYQQHLFDVAITKYGSPSIAERWVLPPEKSMHTWGLAVDFKLPANHAAAFTWLEANSFRFGMCRKYENEWWHFEPLITPGASCPARIKNAQG